MKLALAFLVSVLCGVAYVQGQSLQTDDDNKPTTTPVQPTDATMIVADSGGPIADGDSASGPRDFGVVEMAGMPTATIQITITYSGPHPLKVEAPQVSGDDFVVDLTGFPAGSGIIQPNSTVYFGIYFDASGIGEKVATVSFLHNLGADSATDPMYTFSFEVRGEAVSSAVPEITTTTLPGAELGVPYGPHSISATGGVGELTFAIVVGDLPPGLAMNEAGAVSGIAEEEGLFEFTVEVTDSVGVSVAGPISLSVETPGGPGSGGIGGGASGAAGGGCVTSTGGGLVACMLVLLAAVGARRRRIGSLTR